MPVRRWGPSAFATTGVEGSLDAAMVDGAVSTDVPPSGGLTIDVSGLSSGNKLYDAELKRRINARRYPTATVELRDCTPSAPGSRYRLQGELTFHGITRRAEGTVCVEAVSDDRIVISGEQAFDIRDFAVPVADDVDAADLPRRPGAVPCRGPARRRD